MDLSAPGRRATPGAPVDMPVPVAPSAEPRSAPGSEDEEEVPPGASPLDRGLEGLEGLDDDGDAVEVTS